MWIERQMLTTAQEIARVTTWKEHTSNVVSTYGTQLITLPNTRTWQVMWHWCLQAFLFRDYLSPPQVSKTLCFSESLIKGKIKLTDNANGVTKKCCKCLCCWKRGGNLLNPLNSKLNSISHLLALLGAHPILHVSRIRVKANPRWTADDRYFLWPNDIHSWNQQRTYFMFCLGLLRVLRKSK
jgi:hypothetical protein